MNITVRETNDKKFGLFLGETLIGETKYHFDADFYKNLLDKWAEEWYNKGYKNGQIDKKRE